MIELQLVNPDEIIRAMLNPDFNNNDLQDLDKDAFISVWNDVKLYLLLIVVLAIVIVSMLVASLVKCVRATL